MNEILEGIVEDLINNRLELTNFVAESLEQAERAQNLEEVKTELYKLNQKLGAKAWEIEQRNKRYREALKFYANEDKYDVNVNHDSIGDVDDTTFQIIYIPEGEIINDSGELARKALEDTK